MPFFPCALVPSACVSVSGAIISALSVGTFSCSALMLCEICLLFPLPYFCVFVFFSRGLFFLGELQHRVDVGTN